jgi:dethiobiotin synthetase
MANSLYDGIGMKFFITSSGTGIGKTLVTTTLCAQWRRQGHGVTALKPVISGFDPADPGSDSALILQSCGLTANAETMAAISPWRYTAPLAPNMAAAREGNPVDMAALTAFCLNAAKNHYTLVEGVGGVMAPITDRHTMLDWMVALGWPVIMTTGSYLGSISHTLTAIDALRTRGLRIHALIVCESAESGVPFIETLATLESFLQGAFPIVSLPRLPPTPTPWETMPDISWIGAI